MNPPWHCSLNQSALSPPCSHATLTPCHHTPPSLDAGLSYYDFRLMYSTGQSTPQTRWLPVLCSKHQFAGWMGRKAKWRVWRSISLFYLWKHSLALLRPLDRIGTSPGQIGLGPGQFREVRNKPLVITRQPQEPPNLFFRFGLQTGCNAQTVQELVDPGNRVGLKLKHFIYRAIVHTK